jgi:chemotaxis protein methyltransferase CheR
MELEKSNPTDRLEIQTIASMKISEFNLLSTEINKLCGIQLLESKLLLVDGRIRRRIKVLGLHSFEEYLKYLFSEKGCEIELIPLIDAMTTNKTDFFRENVHFEFLTSTVLPEIENSGQNCFSVWSAGCSTGEEPYTLAIVLNDYFETRKNHNINIYASDISTDVLKIASKGIYSFECIEPIPLHLKKKYLLKGKDPENPQARICADLRRQVNFSRLNFMDADYDIPGNLDAVFCRNVLIYFNKDTQEKVIRKISNKLKTGGYLFLGHSESIIGLKLPLERMAATIYKKV